MANFFKNFMDSLHLNDDDDDDEDYEEYIAQANAREQKRAERMEKKAEREAARPSRTYYREEDAEEIESSRANTASFNETRKERTPKTDKQPAGKVVQFRNGTVNAMGIRVMKPTSFDDSQDICDVLLSGKATIINLEGFDEELSQRVIDFISGAVYATNGRLHTISNYIFIICPENVDISGDYLDMIKQNGFEVPTLNRDL